VYDCNHNLPPSTIISSTASKTVTSSATQTIAPSTVPATVTVPNAQTIIGNSGSSTIPTISATNKKPLPNTSAIDSNLTNSPLATTETAASTYVVTSGDTLHTFTTSYITTSTASNIDGSQTTDSTGTTTVDSRLTTTSSAPTHSSTVDGSNSPSDPNSTSVLTIGETIAAIVVSVIAVATFSFVAYKFWYKKRKDNKHKREISATSATLLAPDETAAGAEPALALVPDPAADQV
jgi:hypothetical protein